MLVAARPAVSALVAVDVLRLLLLDLLVLRLLVLLLCSRVVVSVVPAVLAVLREQRFQ